MGTPRVLHFTPEDIKDAAAAIVRGGLVVFPTETVYGLGANACSDEAVQKIFITKGRPSDNPLIVHIADVEQLSGVVRVVPEYATKLFSFWPGPLTLVLPKAAEISTVATAGHDTVGVRIPKHEGAREFLRACGVPVAAPSANISTRPSSTQLSHVVTDFADASHIFGIFDGGESEIGIESTVLDCTGDIPRILRPGVITAQMIVDACDMDVIDESPVSDETAPRAPGMKYKHYAPTATVHLVLSDDPTLLNLSEHAVVYGVASLSVAIPTRIISEQNVYAAFRDADIAGVTDIYVVDTPELRARPGLYNRIAKAAQGN